MKRILIIERSTAHWELMKRHLQELYGPDLYIEGIHDLEMGSRRNEIYKEEERFDLFFASGEFLLKRIKPADLIKLIGKNESKIVTFSMFSDTLDKLRDKVTLCYSRDEFNFLSSYKLSAQIEKEILSLI